MTPLPGVLESHHQMQFTIITSIIIVFLLRLIRKYLYGKANAIVFVPKNDIYLEWYHHHHHHDVMLLARISLTLSCHFSLLFLASGWSSGLHLVSSHSCCMYVRAGRPAFARPYARVHRSISLMSSSLLLQQCPTRLVRLTCIFFVMGGRWLYCWFLVGCCRRE